MYYHPDLKAPQVDDLRGFVVDNAATWGVLVEDDTASSSRTIHHMNQHEAYDTVGAILDVHKMVYEFILKAVDDIPASRMTEQPGAVVNHPAWTLSHLNAYAGVLLSLLDDPGAPTADAEIERFGYGSTPVPDPAVYAKKRELLNRFRERNERLAGVVRERHAECFPRPAPEKFQPFSPTIGHIAITLLVAHPADHFGQLRRWRRAAGLADMA